MKFSIYNKGIDSIYKTDTLVCYFATIDSSFKYKYLYFSKNIAPYDSEIFNTNLYHNSKYDFDFWYISSDCHVFNRSKNRIVQETPEQVNDNTDRMFLKHRSATSQVNNNVANENLILFPNPFKDILNIESISDLNNMTIEIFELSGKSIFKEIVSEKAIKLDLSNIPSGIYYIKTVFNNSSFLNKLIKL